MQRIDENSRQVGLGYVQGTDRMTLPLAISAINEILIEVIPVTDIGLATSTRLKIDENARQVAGGITDDANEDIVALTVDEIVGLPCVRVEGTFI